MREEPSLNNPGDVIYCRCFTCCNQDEHCRHHNKKSSTSESALADASRNDPKVLQLMSANANEGSRRFDTNLQRATQAMNVAERDYSALREFKGFYIP